MATCRSGRFEPHVPAADELPLDHIPEIPWWSENYCFTGYDYANHVGYFVHLGRWIRDPTIWREEVYLFLPDGTLLTTCGFGRGDCSRGPSGAMLRLECEEPGRRWRIVYSGPVQHLRIGQLMRAPIPEPSRLELLEFNIAFEGGGPMWYFGERDNVTWGRWHVEQHGKIEGALRYGGSDYQVAGHGYRDHSRGPRQFSDFSGHCWIQGRFLDGDSFALYQMWHLLDAETAPSLAEANVVRRGEPLAAKIVTSPRLRSHESALLEAELVLDLPQEQMQIKCIPLTNLIFSFPPDLSHLRLGIPFGDRGWPFTTFEQPALFFCGDRKAEGWMERSFRREEICFDSEAVSQLAAARRVL
jgi:hypothetical protein